MLDKLIDKVNIPEMVKALRYCGTHFICEDDCPRYHPSNEYVDNCRQRLSNDSATAIEALQARLPKRGKWIWIQKANGGQYKGCSVCHAPIPTDSMLDYLDDEDCDFCYSCGAKMEVQE